MVRNSSLVRRLLFIALALLVVPVHAQSPLVVAIKEAPPFVVKTTDGGFSGPAVDLWRHAAEALDIA